MINRLWFLALAVALVAFTSCPWWAAMILFFVVVGTSEMCRALTLILQVLAAQEQRLFHDDEAVPATKLNHLSVVDDDLEAS